MVPGMSDVICPTDTRFRPDLRAYEEGEVETAELAKVEIEEEQRRKRRHYEQIGKTWEPKFFRKVNHPFLKPQQGLSTKIDEEIPYMYKLIEGDQGYWEKRKKGDWKDSQQLWGPFN